MRIDTKIRRGGLLLREGERRDPPLHAFQVSLPKGEGSLKEGCTMREGVTQGVEWAPHVVPITKWPIQWRW